MYKQSVFVSAVQYVLNLVNTRIVMAGFPIVKIVGLLS